MLAGGGAGLWAGTLAAILSTSPGDGADNGAGLLGLLALGLSVLASIVLLVSRREGHVARPTADRAATVLALAAVVLLPATLVIGPLESDVPLQLTYGVLLAGITSFVLAAALYLYASLRRR